MLLTKDSYGYILIIDGLVKVEAVAVSIKTIKIMPRFDRTGPFGCGPGTGWGWGPCMGGGYRRGFGRGFRGRGWGPFMPEITKKEEKELLKEEAEMLEEELKAVKERLTELKGKK